MTPGGAHINLSGHPVKDDCEEKLEHDLANEKDQSLTRMFACKI